MVTSDQDSPSFFYNLANGVTKSLSKALWAIDGSKSFNTVYLEDNFKPIDTEIHQPAEVISGALPSTLQGSFIRNGPNPYYNPGGRYHWFDGDSNLHAVRLTGDGKATYCNHLTETNRLMNEKKAGYPAAGKIGDSVGFTGLMHILVDRLKKATGILNADKGLGTANTALAFHAGKLLALHEGDLPYQIRIACDGLISTIGRVYSGDLKHAFTAHPKIDPVTGEMFTFGYSVEQKPYLWYSRADAQGNIVSDFPVPLPEPIMMHDFAMTEKHVIFNDVPLVFTPEAMVKESRLPFTFRKDRPTRFGVLPRYAQDASEIQWFETDPCMIFHAANAWEGSDGETIELYACCFNDFCLDSFTAIKDSDPYLSRIILNLKTGTVVRNRLSPLAGDFPVVPASLVGRKTRYTYVAVMNTDVGGVPEFYGIAKIDLSTGTTQEDSLVGLIKHGNNRLGGEAYFVPKPGADDEDEGWVMTYVWDGAKHQSELVIYDAKSMSSSPVAVVKLPQRVPHGFHCTFVTEEQMKQMN